MLLLVGCYDSGPEANGPSGGDFAIPDGLPNDDGAACEGVGNHAPETPRVMPLPATPAGIVDTEDPSTAWSGSPFADSDPDDQLGEVQWEIWTTTAGEPDTKVWSATLPGSSQAAVALRDGEFVDPQTQALARWSPHALRVRHRDDNACPLYSEWSEWTHLHTDDGSGGVFDDTIHEVRITIPDDSWDAIDAEARPPGCVPYERSYYRGAVELDGEAFTTNVGVKAKGGCGSARYLDEKAAFKINLEWDDPEIAGCAPRQRWFGQKKITLNNLVQDDSQIRERLGYPFYRAQGVSTPRTGYAQVYVNGEYWGLYLHVESITRRFLARWHDDNDGILYEGTYGCDTVAQDIPGGAGEETECFDQKFKPDVCDDPDFVPPLDHSQLAALVAAIEAMEDGAFYPAIEAHVDFDQFLRVWAVDALMNNWDGFVGSANNYRIYRDPTRGLWSIIPTGIDQNLKFGHEESPFEYGTLLAARCLEEEACTSRFVDTLAEVRADFVAWPFDDLLEFNATLIEDLVAEDPRIETSFDNFVAEQDVIRDFVAERPGVIDDYQAQAGL